MKNKIVLISLSVIVLTGVFVGASQLYKSSEQERIDFLAKENSDLFVREYSPVKGDGHAEIYVTEFLDPECESCRGISSFVNQLMEDYKGKIKLVIRYAPFHQNSRFAIKVLEAARVQGKYWETLDLLFRHQPEWGDHHNPRPELIWTYLPTIGLDIEKLKKDMENPKIDQIIEQDLKDLQQLGVKGTPTFFVNGKPLENFGGSYLREAIEREVQKLPEDDH